MSSSETAPSHTKHTGLTPSDAYNAITDPDILPSLDSETSLPHRLGSYIVLLSLLASGLFAAYIFGVDILQTQTQLVGVGITIALGMGLVGGWSIDWWDLVLGYWWLSMPVAGLAGLMFLLMQEEGSGMVEVE
ncbi:hypothetical protein MMC30_006920 [Trapelia coarctata]|nr:hypothetical protein [Trapelia coarctata]